MRQLPKSKHEVRHRRITRIEEIDVEPEFFFRSNRRPIQMGGTKDKRSGPIAQTARTFRNGCGLEDPSICTRRPMLALTHPGTFRRTGDLPEHASKSASQYVARLARRKVDGFPRSEMKTERL